MKIKREGKRSRTRHNSRSKNKHKRSHKKSIRHAQSLNTKNNTRLRKKRSARLTFSGHSTGLKRKRQAADGMIRSWGWEGCGYFQKLLKDLDEIGTKVSEYTEGDKTPVNVREYLVRGPHAYIGVVASSFPSREDFKSWLSLHGKDWGKAAGEWRTSPFVVGMNKKLLGGYDDFAAEFVTPSKASKSPTSVHQ